MQIQPNTKLQAGRTVKRVGRRRALTLLEMIIGLTLMVMLLAAALTFFWQTTRVREQAGLRADRTLVARSVLGHLSEELRGALGADQIGFNEPRLVGDRRSITFITSGLPADQQYHFFGESEEPPPAAHDVQLVSYQLWIDPDEKTEEGEPLVGGLIRTQKRTFNQNVVDEEDVEQVRHDLWAPEIGYLEFRYYDGVEWAAEWTVQQGNSLPQLIQVTVGFDDITEDELEDRDLSEYPISEFPFGPEIPHDDRFSVIVKLPAADKFFGSRIQRVGQQMAEQFGVEGSGL